MGQGYEAGSRAELASHGPGSADVPLVLSLAWTIPSHPISILGASIPAATGESWGPADNAHTQLLKFSKLPELPSYLKD